jgi:hypothetical protein
MDVKFELPTITLALGSIPIDVKIPQPAEV